MTRIVRVVEPAQLIEAPAPSRFAVRRQEAATRAGLELAGDLARLARDATERARSLLATASASDQDIRRTAMREALVSLRAAHELMGEILQEMSE